LADGRESLLNRLSVCCHTGEVYHRFCKTQLSGWEFE
jgi:hypothetical protein